MSRTKAKAARAPKPTTKPPEAKAITSPEVWIHSSVRVGDLTQKYTVRRDQAELILRARSYIHICAALNAQYASQVPIKLYGRGVDVGAVARKAGRDLRCKRPSQTQWRRMRDPFGVGAKHAADVADDTVEVLDHPALELLDTPNTYDTGSEFMRSTYYHAQIQGNMYWMVEQEGGARTPPTALERMLPQYVVIQAGEDRLIQAYRYGRDQSIAHDFQPDEVIHHKFAPSPLDPYYGIGCLHAVADEADILFAAIQYELAFYQNDSRPGIVVKVAPGTTNDQVETLRELFRRRHRGPSNAGQPLIAQDLEAEHLDPPLREMQYVEGQERLQRIIYAAFGVPRGIMELAEGGVQIGAGGTVSGSMLQYQRQTIAPMVQHLCATLNSRLLAYYGVRKGELWFAPENPSVEDERALEESGRADTAAAVVTIDEARAARGLPPLADGLGAIPRYQGVPLAQVGASPFGGMGGLFGGGGGASGGGLPIPAARLGIPPSMVDEPREPEADAPKPEGEPQAKALPQAVEAARWSDCWFDPARVVEVKAFDSPRSANGVMTFTEAAETWYRTLASAIRAGNVPTDPFVTAASLFDDLTRDSIEAIFADGYDDGANRLGAAKPPSLGAFVISDEYQQEFLRGYRIRLATEVTETVRTRITEAVSRMIADGLPPSAVSREISDAMDESAAWMGERIARTESARAFVGGNLKAWADSGVVRGKKWLRAPGCCEFCDAAARKYGTTPIPLDQPFYRRGDVITAGGRAMVLDYSDVDGPPLHPNDRCDVVAVIQGA